MDLAKGVENADFHGPELRRNHVKKNEVIIPPAPVAVTRENKAKAGVPSSTMAPRPPKITPPPITGSKDK